MRQLLIVVCAGLAAVTMPAFAQDVERYRLERTDSGYVRLDSETGQMSICEERAGQLLCKMAVEEREAYDLELDLLHRRIERLEQRVALLEAGGDGDRLPTDEEFEQTMGYMEQFFRRFMGIVKDLERDFSDDEAQPEADRT